MAQVCPLCGIDDFVESIILAPGYYEFTCTRPNKHSDPRVWRGTGGHGSEPAGGTGPVPIEDVREALLSCVHAGEPWVEYGIVEARYALTAPEDFETLREEYGHRILGPKKSPNFTTSAYLGRALGDLRETGLLAHMTGKATGDWAYNSGISYWAKPPPGPPKTSALTYEVFTTKGPQAVSRT